VVDELVHFVHAAAVLARLGLGLGYFDLKKPVT
jgi:hypothetical protein